MNEAKTRAELIDHALRSDACRPRRIPSPEALDQHALSLAHLLARTSWLPHPDVVRVLGRAVFPTIRDIRRRFQTFNNSQGEIAGMYDDNHTPKWAFLWAHGITRGSGTGWTFAHVWPSSDDITAYTHVGNMAMVLECFSSLTDKSAPLTAFLRWHAWSHYGWKPAAQDEPKKPTGYENISWRYLEKQDNPGQFIRERIALRNDQRLRILRPIMERLGML